MPAPEVHVACARVADLAAGDWLELDDWLDGSERERALRFRFEEDRNAYVLAHALRRALVARATGRKPSSLRFSHTAQGQPCVQDEPHLNVSNSATRSAAACAVTLSGPIGIDVEGIQARQADMELLASFVVPAAHESAADFFVRWALLEAFWKAWGTGLAQDNARIVVSQAEGGRRFGIHTEGAVHGAEGTGWMLDAFHDCATALVLRGPVREPLRLRQTRCGSAMDVKQLSRAI